MKHSKISNIIAFNILAWGGTCVALITTSCGPKQLDLSLTAETNTPNDSNHGRINDNNEISFNTYDDQVLTISLVELTNNNNLQWKWARTIDQRSWDDIPSLTSTTKFSADYSTIGTIKLTAAEGDVSQFLDFYIEATLENSIPKPIHVYFHNAPEVKSGGIIDFDSLSSSITSFNDSNVLSKYDTIYIPSEVKSISSNIFNDKFVSSANGNCHTIQNVIFADRTSTCDVGANAFSSSTILVLKGDVYIGVGTYLHNDSDTLFFSTYSSRETSITMGDVIVNGSCCGFSSFFSAYCSQSSYGSRSALIDMDNVIINGNCDGHYFFSSYSTSVATVRSASPWSSIKMGDVTIGGNCSGYYFFSSYAYTDSGRPFIHTSSIEMGDVTIGGNCTSYNGCFFSAASISFVSYGEYDGPTFSCSIKMGDVIISGNCISFSGGGSPIFFSAYYYCYDSPYGPSVQLSQIEMGNVTIGGNCSCGDAYDNACFFSAYLSSDSLSSSSIKMGDVIISNANQITVLVNGDYEYFFYASRNTMGLQSLSFDSAVFKCRNPSVKQPSHINQTTITWPITWLPGQI